MYMHIYYLWYNWGWLGVGGNVEFLEEKNASMLDDRTGFHIARRDERYAATH